jgi:hypothetical protein
MNAKIIKREKGMPDRVVRKGKLFTQQSPPRTGKTTRANAWQKKDPEIRRVVEGDRKEAENLRNEGFDVMLNLLPGM